MAFLGVEIGGTTTRAALIDDLGHLCGDVQVATETDGSVEAVLRLVARAAQAACERVGIRLSAIDSACLGIPALIDHDRNTVLSAPTLGWGGETDIVSVARRCLDIPIVVENDAICAATGSAEFGVGNHYDDFLLLKLGSTVGVAAVSGGRVIADVRRYGTDPSELRGSGVAFHNRFSAGALVRLARVVASGFGSGQLFELTGGDLGRLNAALVFEAARHGDPVAQAAIDRFGEWAAEETTRMVLALRPEAVVIAGSLAKSGDQLRVPFEAALEGGLGDAGAPMPDIVISSMAPTIGAYGAAVIALRISGVDPAVEALRT